MCRRIHTLNRCIASPPLNEDTTQAALHILDDPAFKVFVPQQDPKLRIHPAIERLRGERDQTAQKSLLLLLWYVPIPEGDKVLSDFVSDSSKPDATRARAKELLGRKPEPFGRNRAVALVRSEAGIRELRRQRMKAVSDKALYELDDYTHAANRQTPPGPLRAARARYGHLGIVKPTYAEGAATKQTSANRTSGPRHPLFRRCNYDLIP